MRCGACGQTIRPGEDCEPRLWAADSGPGTPGHAHVECPPEDDAEERSLSAGRAAGYCWERNPSGPGRCTRPPGEQHEDHRDVYAGTAWQ